MSLSASPWGYTLGFSNLRGGFADSSRGVRLFHVSLYTGTLCGGFLCLFLPVSPMGRGLFRRVSACRIPYVSHIPELLFSPVRTSQESGNVNIMTNSGPGAGCVTSNEQYVHRCVFLSGVHTGDEYPHPEVHTGEEYPHPEVQRRVNHTLRYNGGLTTP